jgi:hypothetical protein
MLQRTSELLLSFIQKRSKEGKTKMLNDLMKQRNIPTPHSQIILLQPSVLKNLVLHFGHCLTRASVIFSSIVFRNSVYWRRKRPLQYSIKTNQRYRSEKNVIWIWLRVSSPLRHSAKECDFLPCTIDNFPFCISEWK